MFTVDQAERDTVEAVDGVHLTQLAAGERMSVQHYHFEPGAQVPEHSHHHEQVGFVYRGSLAFMTPAAEDAEPDPRLGEGGPVDAFVVSAGESYCVPGDEPHVVENRGDTPAAGVDIFSPPREASPWE